MPVACQEKRDRSYYSSSTSSHVNVQLAQGMDLFEVTKTISLQLFIPIAEKVKDFQCCDL